VKPAHLARATTKENDMKINYAALLSALALALPASNLLAQDAEQPQPNHRPRLEQRDGNAPNAPRDGAPQDGQRPRGPRPDGQGPDGQRPMKVPPIIAALDVNHDGEIDAKEIENAAAALKKLDKNGDGKLTLEELLPARAANPPRGGDNQDGPRPPRDPRFQGGDRPDGPPPVDGQGPQRRGPRPPQDDKQ